jgi:succinoglycan biosynthesis transport protein ExoP
LNPSGTPSENQLSPAPVTQRSGTRDAEAFDLLRLFRRRRKIILLSAGVIVLLGALLTIFAHRIYESQAKLVVNTKNQGPGAGGDSILSSLTDLTGDRNVDTQVEVVDSLDLLKEAYTDLPRKDRIDGFGYVGFDPKKLEWSYTITSKPETDVILITTRAFSPRIAAEFADKIMHVYLMRDLSQNSQATRQARTYVERELTNSRDRLQEATAKLAQYKRETGLIAIDSQLEAISTGAIQLRQALEVAKADAAGYTDQAASLEADTVKQHPEIQFQTTVAQDPNFQAVETTLADLETQLVQAEAEYKPTSIPVQTLKAQLAVQKGRLAGMTKDYVAAATTQHNLTKDALYEAYAGAIASQVQADAHVTALQRDYDQHQKELTGFPEKERRMADLQEQVDILTQTDAALAGRYYELLIQEKSLLPSGIIAANGWISPEPASPRILLNVILTIIMATAVGLGFGMLAEKLDTKFHSATEIEEFAGRPILSVIPEARRDGATTLRPIVEATADQMFTEAFRLLRNNIAFSSPTLKIRVLAVTSSMKSEGKSTVALNLAIAFAMDGKRVLLLDADLRRPAVHSAAEVKNDVGYTNVVLGLVPFAAAVQPTQWPSVDVLTSGPLPPNPTEFLNTEASRDVIAAAKELYDIVIVDCPPSVGLSDMQIISTIADSVLFVAGLDVTTRHAFAGSIRLLDLARANLLGVVVNRAKRDAWGYYGYYGDYGYYGYTGYYGADDDDQDKTKKKRKKRTKLKG